MLEVGNGDLTGDENRAHFALWAILAAPLMAGNDLRAMSREVRELLTAPEIVAVDQDALGRQGRRIHREDGCEVWVRELANGDRAVAALNGGPSPHELRVALGDLGLPAGRVRVRDLWRRTDEGERRGEIILDTTAHSATVLRIAPY
jgi:alpha-galactosidase